MDQIEYVEYINTDNDTPDITIKSNTAPLKRSHITNVRPLLDTSSLLKKFNIRSKPTPREDDHYKKLKSLII